MRRLIFGGKFVLVIRGAYIRGGLIFGILRYVYSLRGQIDFENLLVLENLLKNLQVEENIFFFHLLSIKMANFPIMFFV